MDVSTNKIIVMDLEDLGGGEENYGEIGQSHGEWEERLTGIERG